MAERVIKKSPVSIVKNFIILQASAILAYFLASHLGYYAKFYRSFSVSNLISFQIAQAIFVFGAETLIIFYIFFRWYKEYWQIHPRQIVYGKGVLFRKKTIIPLGHISEVSFRQGPLGKLVKYGAIELFDSHGQKKFSFKDLPEPQDTADLIMQLKQTADFSSVSSGKSSDLEQLVKKGEHENLEFKSTFRWDLRSQKVNQQLEKSVMKTVAAFLNSQGGQIILGVDDRKNVVGMEADYLTLNKQGPDGFENHFSNIFQHLIGAEFRALVKLHWQKSNEKDLCIVSVAPSSKPVFLKTDNNEEFFIRTGNATTSLKLSEASSYINSRFKNSLV